MLRGWELSEPLQVTGGTLTYGTTDPGDEGTGSKGTLASAVYNQLRDDLLRGVLESESKLRVEWVVSKYGAGASPVREALNRLAFDLQNNVTRLKRWFRKIGRTAGTRAIDERAFGISSTKFERQPRRDLGCGDPP